MNIYAAEIRKDSILRGVYNELNIVTVGITHKGAVIMLVVFGAETGCALILSARRERGRMKRIDFRMRGSQKRHVCRARDLPGKTDSQIRHVTNTESGVLFAAANPAHAEGCERS